MVPKTGIGGMLCEPKQWKTTQQRRQLQALAHSCRRNFGSVIVMIARIQALESEKKAVDKTREQIESLNALYTTIDGLGTVTYAESR